jgi:hypothetical protein
MEENINVTNLKKPKNQKIIGIVVLVALVVVAVLFASYFWKNNVAQQVPVSKNTSNIDPNVILQKAKSGEVVAGFPKELIVDKNATNITSAENASKDPSKRLIVSSYQTTESFDSLDKMYNAFFKTQGWVVYQDKKDSKSLNIVAGLPNNKNGINIIAFKNNQTSKNLVMMLFTLNK